MPHPTPPFSPPTENLGVFQNLLCTHGVFAFRGRDTHTHVRGVFAFRGRDTHTHVLKAHIGRNVLLTPPPPQLARERKGSNLIPSWGRGPDDTHFTAPDNKTAPDHLVTNHHPSPEVMICAHTITLSGMYILDSARDEMWGFKFLLPFLPTCGDVNGKPTPAVTQD